MPIGNTTFCFFIKENEEKQKRDCEVATKLMTLSLSFSFCFGGLNGTVFEPLCGGVGGVLVLIGSKKSLREGGGNGVSIFRKYSKTDIKKKCILAKLNKSVKFHLLV